MLVFGHRLGLVDVIAVADLSLLHELAGSLMRFLELLAHLL